MRLIRAPRLMLEPQVAAHADAMFGVLGDPAIYAFENTPPPSVAWLRERFACLETRWSGDGTQQWLNWVIRLAPGDLAGYVQATVHGDGTAAIAYVLGSAWWGRGLAHEAVAAMIAELSGRYRVRQLTAIFKSENRRSRRLLERLEFVAASPARCAASGVEGDEAMMVRVLDRGASAAGAVS
jgi:[ribosomal protein S5]-alanine N-acetyltransferase